MLSDLTGFYSELFKRLLCWIILQKKTLNDLIPCKIITVCQFAKTKGIYKWDEESHCSYRSSLL